MPSVHVSLENLDKGYIFSEFEEDLDLFDDEELDMGDIYRTAQKEYGRCQSKVYVDTEKGPKPIGWYFVKRCEYDNGWYSKKNDTYLQGAWVTVVD